MGFSISPQRSSPLDEFLGIRGILETPTAPRTASENYLVGGDLTMVNSDENSG